MLTMKSFWHSWEEDLSLPGKLHPRAFPLGGHVTMSPLWVVFRVDVEVHIEGVSKFAKLRIALLKTYHL